GLSTAYGIVRRNGGGVDVARALGRGTTLTITPPVHAGPPAAPPTPLPRTPSPRGLLLRRAAPGRGGLGGDPSSDGPAGRGGGGGRRRGDRALASESVRPGDRRSERRRDGRRSPPAAGQGMVRGDAGPDAHRLRQPARIRRRAPGRRRPDSEQAGHPRNPPRC